MKKVVLTVLKIAGIVLLVLILLIAGFLFWLSRRPFVPKASALPTALHPDMKFSNCGQTCGQRRFLTSYRRG